MWSYHFIPQSRDKPRYFTDFADSSVVPDRDKYLLLVECEVRTASYGPRFFLPSRSGHEIKEGKSEDP